jgi:heat shock protein HtpX
LLFIAFFFLVAGLATAIGFVLNNLILGWGIGLIFFCGYGLFAYYNGSNMALSLTGAQPADQNEYRTLHNVVEEIAIAASIPKPDVYIMENDTPNAFATGMKPEKSAVAVTTGLLKTMNRDELTGVVAHEIAHIKHQDTKTMLIAGVLVGSIAILSDIFFRVSIFGGGRERNNWVFIIIGLLAMILAPVIAELIRLAVSRKREFAADAKAVEYTRNSSGMSGALRKLKQVSKVSKAAPRSLNHMFIRSNLDDKGLMNRLFSTHPPLDERIARVEAL